MQELTLDQYLDAVAKVLREYLGDQFELPRSFKSDATAHYHRGITPNGAADDLLSDYYPDE